MNERDKISIIENKLKERLSSIFTRLQRVKYSNTSIDNVTSDAFQSDESELRNLKITPGQIDFYDENWRDIIKQVKTKDIDGSLQSFVNNFILLSSQKVDLSELPEKSDRQYVDSLIEEMNQSVQQHIDESLEESYCNIRDELEQARINIETIRQQFDQNIEMLKKDLQKSKKSMQEPEEPEESNISQFLSKKTNYKPLQKNKLILMAPVSKKPQPYRTGVKKRSMTQLKSAIENVQISGLLLPDPTTL